MKVLEIWKKSAQGRLGRQTALLILSVSSVLTCISILWQIGSDFSSELTRVKESVAKIETTTLPSLGRSLWNLDRDQIHLILDGIIKQPSIVGVRVIDISGKMYEEMGRAADSKERVHNFPLYALVNSQNQQVGSLQLSESYESLYQQLWIRLINIAFTQLIKTFLMSFIIIGIVERLITRHLRSLEVQVKRISQLSKPETIAVNRKPSKEPDEIDQVIEAINRLLRENYQNISALERIHSERLLMVAELVEAQQGVAIQELATGIIHDLNNLLTIVHGNAALLQNIARTNSFFTDAKFDKLLSSHLEKIISASDGAMRIATLQLDSAKSKTQAEQLNLNETIKSVLLIEERDLKRSRVEVQVAINPEHNIWMPSGIILTILINILKNAVEAFELMPDGYQARLSIRSWQEEKGTLVLSISDNGPGLSSEVKDKLFNHGFTTKKTGHGFGLHFCKSLIEANEGSISVNSEGANQGTTFYLILPTNLSQKMLLEQKIGA